MNRLTTYADVEVAQTMEELGGDMAANNLKMNRSEVLAGIEEIPASIRTELPELEHELLWLFDNAILLGHTMADLDSLLDFDKTNIKRAFLGTYAGSWRTVLEKIQSYHKARETRILPALSVGFVRTSIADRIFRAFDHAAEIKCMVLIIGPKGIGKTEAMKAWIRQDKFRRARYLRMRTVGGMTSMLRFLGRSLGGKEHSSNDLNASEIFNSTNFRTLIGLDEFQKCYQTGSERQRVDKLEFIRDWHDVSGCPIVINATRVFRDEMEHGRHKKLLEQFRDRAEIIQLPERAPLGDFALIAHSYKLDMPGEKSQAMDRIKLCREELSIRVFTRRLDHASNVAAAEGEGLAWRHFVSVFDALYSEARGGEEDGE